MNWLVPNGSKWCATPTSSPFSAAEVWFIIAEGWSFPLRPRLSQFLPRGRHWIFPQSSVPPCDSSISIIGSASSGGFFEIPHIGKSQAANTCNVEIIGKVLVDLPTERCVLMIEVHQNKMQLAMYSLFPIKCRKRKSSHHSAQPEHAVQSAPNAASAHALLQGSIGILPGSPTATNDCPWLDPT